MQTNEIYVTTDLQDTKLWSRELTLADMHWINGEPAQIAQDAIRKTAGLAVRTRYRAPLIKLDSLVNLANGQYKLVLQDEIRALTAGQSAVIYNGDRVLGGGIVV
jgi:tRNA-specific 2-thiouridylase